MLFETFWRNVILFKFLIHKTMSKNCGPLWTPCKHGRVLLQPWHPLLPLDMGLTITFTIYTYYQEDKDFHQSHTLGYQGEVLPILLASVFAYPLLLHTASYSHNSWLLPESRNKLFFLVGLFCCVLYTVGIRNNGPTKRFPVESYRKKVLQNWVLW